MMKRKGKKRAPLATAEKTVFRGYRLYPSDTAIVKDGSDKLSEKEDRVVSESEFVRCAIRAFKI